MPADGYFVGRSRLADNGYLVKENSLQLSSNDMWLLADLSKKVTMALRLIALLLLAFLVHPVQAQESGEASGTETPAMDFPGRITSTELPRF